MATPFGVLVNAWSGSVSASTDSLPIWQAATNSAFYITRNQLLNLAGNPVGDSDTQTLTNKTLTSPTISGPTLSGTITGTYTIGGTPTFPSSVVTLTGTQSLSNKTLTSPTLTSPTLTNATISADALTGYTTSNTGTIYGISVTTGVITTAGSIGAGAIANNSIQAAQLATNAITLGYAQITSNSSTTTSATYVGVAGLSATVTIPSGGRRVKITAWTRALSNGTDAANSLMSIWDGTVGSGTQLTEAVATAGGAGGLSPVTCIAVVTPAAGSKTYNVGIGSDGTHTVGLTAASFAPAFILVEAI
jgi:hypothetical protein